jgi:ATPase family AAA domain-containing protein 3A/B
MAPVVYWKTSALLLAVGGPLAPLQANGNWLLQCSSCVDQAYFSDDSLKENIKDADVSVLMSQLKRLRLREFDHREDEFYNKFFSKRQLGVITQELQHVMPSAVATLPERRWTNTKGMSNMTKNVMMLRDSHLLMVVLGSAQHLALRAEHWDASIDRLNKEMVDVVEEQQDNRHKREEMLDQIVRTIAKVEVLQHAFVKTEEGFVRLESSVDKFRIQQEGKHAAMHHGLEEVKNATEAQNGVIARFQEDFRFAVEREARADLVEKRKAADADLEVALVKRSIEKLRWEEEQKTIDLRSQEQRRNDDHSSKLHQERTAHEVAQKKAADLELMQNQEESNIRQEEIKRKGEKELLLLRLQSDERRAEMGVQEAIEKAKVDAESKIRAARENEDVNLRAMRSEMQEKRQQTLAAIKATADIALSWIKAVYGSPQNLALAIGSVVVAIGGVYLTREMAVLLREQLNKRLGRPSLVRMTNRRGFVQQVWLGLLRLLRLRSPHGSEFSDVVMHPKLHQQVMRLAEATRSAKRRNMPLQHAMFYGPPGTGKTMVAQRFAEYSGLEYAIMSGGDVAPLEEQAVTELHKLFQWVHRSRRGVLLFIDEADAFLVSRKRGNMSETLRNALTTMLYHTGTPSSQFMLVCATNRPGDLDSAVLDRLDEAVEFGLPDIDARRSMINLYFNMYITKPLGIAPVKEKAPGPDAVEEFSGHGSVYPGPTEAIVEEKPPLGNKPSGVLSRSPKQPPAASPSPLGAKSKPMGEEEAEMVDQAALAEAARRLHGFSGREIAKLFTSLQTHVLYSHAQLTKQATAGRSRGRATEHHLPRSMLFEVVDQKVKEHDTSADFQASGYNYENTEEKLMTEFQASGYNNFENTEKLLMPNSLKVVPNNCIV